MGMIMLSGSSPDCNTSISLCRFATAYYGNSGWGGYTNPWTDYFNTGGVTQMELSTSQSYLIRGAFKEAYGSDYLRVRVPLASLSSSSHHLLPPHMLRPH